MSRKRQLASRSEDANATRVRFRVGWEYEYALRVIELARDSEHLTLGKAARVRNHGEWIAAMQAIGEDVGGVKGVSHAPKNVRRPSPSGYQRLSRQAPAVFSLTAGL
jgi:hypothetical protein